MNEARHRTRIVPPRRKLALETHCDLAKDAGALEAEVIFERRKST